MTHDDLAKIAPAFGTKLPDYGPSIPVNGKRPDWLDNFEMCVVDYDLESPTMKTIGSTPNLAAHRGWPDVRSVQVRPDHPYYQSAEYKASVGEVQHIANGMIAGDRSEAIDFSFLQKAWDAEERWEGDFARPDLSGFVKRLEAAGYTVTPPDPLAADREFLAGLMGACGWPSEAGAFRAHCYEDSIPAAMEYLRAWANNRRPEGFDCTGLPRA